MRRVGEAAQQVAVPLAARAVIGPGTGLGVAGLVPCPTDAAEPGEPPRGSGGPPQAVQAVQAVQAGQAGQAGHDEPAEPSRAPAGATRWLAIAGEGGHVSLAADDDFESTLLAAVRRQHAHVSAERLLSGIGLPDLHQAVAQVRGAAAPALRTEAIVAAGLAAPGESGADALCRETLEHFCALLGGFAGNVALTLGARGGVYIGGGIVPRLGDLFLRSRFRTRFEAKGRFTDYLRAIPTWVIVDTQVALSGAAMALQQRRAG
ncbi:MAG: glucokinase [Burkholderiales bacterium]|nr:glucokinase [Burkholderiales bacterium]